jgi:hypothetical protein
MSFSTLQILWGTSISGMMSVYKLESLQVFSSKSFSSSISLAYFVGQASQIMLKISW